MECYFCYWFLHIFEHHIHQALLVLLLLLLLLSSSLSFSWLVAWVSTSLIQHQSPRASIWCRFAAPWVDPPGALDLINLKWPNPTTNSKNGNLPSYLTKGIPVQIDKSTRVVIPGRVLQIGGELQKKIGNTFKSVKKVCTKNVFRKWKKIEST